MQSMKSCTANQDRARVKQRWYCQLPFRLHSHFFSWLWKSLIQVYYWIGWKPDKNQPKPLRPQKSDVSRPQSINICFLCKWLSGELKRSLQTGWTCWGQGFHRFDWWQWSQKENINHFTFRYNRYNERGISVLSRVKSSASKCIAVHFLVWED